MGERANYAILDGSRLELYYAHWGGLAVPREVARGPEACLAFIREQEEPEGWLDFAFMQGAIAMDLVRRAALCFGGPPPILYDKAVQQRFLERIGPLWESHGWSLRWADDYAYGLMDFLGLPRSTVEMDFPFPEPGFGECLEPDSEIATLLARTDKQDPWDLRAVPRPVHVLPALVTELLERWSELPRYQGQKLPPSLSALLLDPTARCIELLAPLFGTVNQPYRTTERLYRHLPDWTSRAEVSEVPVAQRLGERGLPVSYKPALVPSPRDLAEIDAIVDGILSYTPELRLLRSGKA